MFGRIWKTKSFWTGIGGVVAGVGLIVAGQVGEGVTTIVISIQKITQRDAIAKLEK